MYEENDIFYQHIFRDGRTVPCCVTAQTLSFRVKVRCILTGVDFELKCASLGEQLLSSSVKLLVQFTQESHRVRSKNFRVAALFG